MCFFLSCPPPGFHSQEPHAPDGHAHGHGRDGLERDDGHEDREVLEGPAEVREPVDDGAEDQGADEVEGQLGEELRLFCLGRGSAERHNA